MHKNVQLLLIIYELMFSSKSLRENKYACFPNCQTIPWKRPYYAQLQVSDVVFVVRLVYKKNISFSLLLKDFFSLKRSVLAPVSFRHRDVAQTWSGSREEILAECVTWWCSQVTEAKLGFKTGCFWLVMCSVFCGIVGSSLWCSFISLQTFYMHKMQLYNTKEQWKSKIWVFSYIDVA